jgi:hypothetical protein
MGKLPAPSYWLSAVMVRRQRALKRDGLTRAKTREGP